MIALLFLISIIFYGVIYSKEFKHYKEIIIRKNKYSYNELKNKTNLLKIMCILTGSSIPFLFISYFIGYPYDGNIYKIIVHLSIGIIYCITINLSWEYFKWNIRK